MRALGLFALVGVSGGHGSLCAQAPRARATLSPGAVVTVGQPVTLRVDVLVPSFFTGAPAFEQLDVDDAITVFVDRGTNFTERENAVTWAGQDRSYTIYPQRSGAYEIGGVSVEVRYRGESGIETATVTTPAIRFEARLPPEAEGLDYFIATTALTLEGSFDPRPDTIRVGDAFKRTITVTVTEALSIVIPPGDIDSVSGLSVYPDPPRVDDTGGERGAVIVGRRIESVTYVAEAEGAYTLPGRELIWWDARDERLREEQLPALDFFVVPNPDLVEEIALPPDSLDAGAPSESSANRRSLGDLARRWAPGLVSLLFLLATTTWLGRRYGSGWKSSFQEARARRADSEAIRFRLVRKAAVSNDPRATANALLTWLDSLEQGTATVAAFAATAADPALSRELEVLGRRLYGPEAGASTSLDWSGAALVSHLATARSKLRAGRRSPTSTRELSALNP